MSADKFVLRDNSESDSGFVTGRIERNSMGIEIFLDGYGVCTQPDGAPIYIEFYEGELRVHVWNDINAEDPSHTISLEGAHEDNYQPSTKEWIAQSYRNIPEDDE